MMRGRTLACALGVTWLVTCANTLAVPILAIDLDPAVPDIQATLVVPTGSPFDVDVVLVGDGVSLFETVGLDVISSLSLTGGPVAGDLVGTASVLDPFSLSPSLLGLGDPLSIVLLPPLPGGFGGVSMASIFGPFPVLAAGGSTTVLQLTFVAPTAGNHSLSLAPLLGDFLVFAGASVPVQLEGASVVAESSTPVSEPITLWLIATGLAGALLRQRHQSTR